MQTNLVRSLYRTIWASFGGLNINFFLTKEQLRNLPLPEPQLIYFLKKSDVFCQSETDVIVIVAVCCTFQLLVKYRLSSFPVDGDRNHINFGN